MVKGNPLKLMLQFALPLLIGNLLQQTYNIIDAAIVGQILGAKALASVGASSSVQFLVLGFCMGSCTGFGVPVAKYFGADDLEKMRNYIFNGAVLVAAIAVVVTGTCSILCPQILHLLSVPEDIFEGAYAYLIVIFLGIPFTLMYNYLSSVLRSVGDSRTPFIFLAFSACLNIFLEDLHALFQKPSDFQGLHIFLVLLWDIRLAPRSVMKGLIVKVMLPLLFFHAKYAFRQFLTFTLVSAQQLSLKIAICLYLRYYIIHDAPPVLILSFSNPV